MTGRAILQETLQGWDVMRRPLTAASPRYAICPVKGIAARCAESWELARGRWRSIARMCFRCKCGVNNVAQLINKVRNWNDDGKQILGGRADSFEDGHESSS